MSRLGRSTEVGETSSMLGADYSVWLPWGHMLVSQSELWWNHVLICGGSHRRRDRPFLCLLGDMFGSGAGKVQDLVLKFGMFRTWNVTFFFFFLKDKGSCLSSDRP